MGMTLAGCNPNFNDSSSVGPDSKTSDSSGEVSSSSSEDTSGEETSTTENTSSGGGQSTTEDTSSSESGGSSSSSETPPGPGPGPEPSHTHDFSDGPHFETNVDYMTYRKGYNIYKCTYPGCEETTQEEVKFTKAEMLDLMNAFIDGKTYYDIFEAKQDLIDNNYPIVDALSATEYFGYDLTNNRVALSTDTSVTNFVSYREKVVNR